MAPAVHGGTPPLPATVLFHDSFPYISAPLLVSLTNVDHRQTHIGENFYNITIHASDDYPQANVRVRKMIPPKSGSALCLNRPFITPGCLVAQTIPVQGPLCSQLELDAESPGAGSPGAESPGAESPGLEYSPNLEAASESSLIPNLFETTSLYLA